MRVNFIISVLSILIMGACVDRLSYDIQKSAAYSISVDGFISNRPGPYRVNINRTFDIESKTSTKTGVFVKSVILSDDEGTSEELMGIDQGIYETSDKGIQGQVGRAYKLRIELFDGRIYESAPDTLLPPGKMDSVYFSFLEVKDPNGVSDYSFDIFANSSKGSSAGNRFMWNTTGTFRADTHPELADIRHAGCEPLPGGKCNFLPLCTGLQNISPPSVAPVYVRVKPCECCTCWYKIFNDHVILSDAYFSSTAHYDKMKVFNIPVTGWIFMYKIHVGVSQLSLTRNSFRFWKAIRDQHNAIGNLFQPVSGKIPGNFIQLTGEESPVFGLFYAASMSSKSTYINRIDVPQQIIIPDGYIPATPLTPCVGCLSCLELFPNATNVKPPFWID